MYQAFNFAGNLVALFAQRCELLGQTRHDDGCCLSTGYDHSLFAKRLNDFGSKAFADARCKFGEAVCECFLAGCGKVGGRRATGTAQADRARPGGPGAVPAPVPVRDGSG